MKRANVTMMRWMPVVLCLTAILVVVSMDARANNTGKRPPLFKPQAPLEDLMHLNKSINKKLRKRLGAEPDFKAAEHDANLLTEIANVLQYHRDPDVEDWWGWAGDFRDGAKRVAAAAKAEDLAGARAAVKAMSKSCKKCHDKYQD